MKYRLLTWEELLELEKEFIEFLAVNGIDGQEWSRIKGENPEKSDRFIELFSDVVFEASMRKVKFLEMRSKHHLVCFQCLEKELVAVGMRDPMQRDEIDFTDSNFIQNSASKPPGNLEVYTNTKKYDSQREIELFELTTKGAVITDNKLFNSLCLAL
jgi:hypothetical protein